MIGDVNENFVGRELVVVAHFLGGVDVDGDEPVVCDGAVGIFARLEGEGGVFEAVDVAGEGVAEFLELFEVDRFG